MQSMYYIGLDVHKKTISYCVKDGSGRIHAEGTIAATRLDRGRWMKTLPQPWKQPFLRVGSTIICDRTQLR
jgi:transposase